MSISRHTLDPKLDIVFWMLFGRESNRTLLVSLLTAVLTPAEPIVHVELLNPELERAAMDEKGIVLDLRVMLGSGEQVDIEMQSRPHPAFNERILYYWSKLYVDQLKRGFDYTELRRTIGVLFQSFPRAQTSRFHSIFRVSEQHTHALFTDQLELHVVELPQLRGAVAEKAEPLLMLWCRFLSATTDDELELLAEEHPTMTQAKTALDELSADPRARQQAEFRELSQVAYATSMNAARREGRAEGKAEGRAEGKAEGRAEGKAEGRAEGKAEMLLRLLGLKFGTLPEATVEWARSAGEAEVDRMMEKVLTADRLDEIIRKRET